MPAGGLFLLLMLLGTSLIHFISSVKTVKPSKPRCYADGPTEEGKDVVLKCVSSDGTPPLKYSWEKTSDNKLLPASSVMGKCALTQALQNKHSTVLKVSYYATVLQEIGLLNMYFKFVPGNSIQHVPKNTCFGSTEDKKFWCL